MGTEELRPWPKKEEKSSHARHGGACCYNRQYSEPGAGSVTPKWEMSMSRNSCWILVCVVAVLGLGIGMWAQPATAGLVTNGLAVYMTASTDYNAGANQWTDSVTGDPLGYDPVGSKDELVTYSAPAGGDPGFFTFGSGQNTDTGLISFSGGGIPVGTDDFTYAVWLNLHPAMIYPTHAGGIGASSSGAGGEPNQGFGIWRLSSSEPCGGCFRAWVNDDGGNYADRDTLGETAEAGMLSDQQWHLWTVTRSGNDLHIYRDDQNVDTGTWKSGDTVDLKPSLSPPNIGTGYQTARDGLAGSSVAAWGLWNRALSPGEIDGTHLPIIGPPAGSPGTDFTWNSSESGDWVAASNWTGPGGFPGETIDNGTPPVSTPDRQSALFGDAIGSTGRTVVIDTSVSVNVIHFDNSSASYAIAGLGSVNLLASTRPVAPNPAINVAADNSHQFQASVKFHANGTVDIGSGSTLELNNRLFLNGNTLTKTGEGTMAINNNVLTGDGTLNCAQGTCSGTGTVGGDLINVGGTISPGNSLLVDGNVSIVPEPASIALLLLGLIAAFGFFRRH